jgi:hypothetical protein
VWTGVEAQTGCRERRVVPRVVTGGKCVSSEVCAGAQSESVKAGSLNFVIAPPVS